VVNDFDKVLDLGGQPVRELMQDIKNMIILAESERPRSVQKSLGPSEAGHPCPRQLGYKIHRARSADTSEVRGLNTYGDPMPAFIGLAVHDRLEMAAQAANKRLGRIRWVTEQKVVVRLESGDREELAGTCDLYDFDTSTLLDWKVPGATVYSDCVKNGPPEVYRNQVHLYGQGYIRLGFKVKHVGIVFISRTGTLRQTHLWREPYSQSRVDSVLAKLDDVEDKLDQYNVAADPSGLLRLPIVPGKYCSYCPWFSPKPTGPYQCGGAEL